ncbi:hypothetical protein [Micromonospora sp. WMMB235]|uniref:hypothetical protein n=1 Tax=Micromonospora sp. WMMB235 TaxID=1172030 RepID=UPI00115FEA9B|nr:hypothetical protein [Micromonospora sp. WMMB235]
MPEQRVRVKLTRRYRRLLLTYPRSYRRRRGAEIVTTLLDAAPVDRAWPTRAEVVDLLTGGLRFRFRVWGAAGIVGVICAATVTAVALGALGGCLGWQTAQPLPSNADALRMVEPALPPGTSAEPQRWDFIYDDNPEYTDPRWVYLIGGTDEYRAGKVFFQFTYPNDRPVRHLVDGAEQRMRAAGWRPAIMNLSGCCPESAVYRDGWLVEVFSEGALDGSHNGLQVAVSRTTPAAVLPLTTAGLLAGAAAGWLMAAWAFRRIQAATPTRRALTVVVAGVGLLALFPATALSALALVASYFAPHHPAEPAWIGYTFMLFRPLAYLGAAAVVGGLLITAVPGHRHRRRLAS